MLRKARFTVVPLLLAVGLGFIGCSQDEQKPEEVVTPENADSPGAPEADAGANVDAKTVYFAFDDYTVSMDAQATLNQLAERLKANKSAVVQIEGHCDERGSTEYNIALGQRRAQSVKDYLVRLGVEESRLSTISYGEEKPASDGHDEAAWSKNRRAEFVVSSR
jgi:peptidoglycan-associated lipoprotein